MTSKRLLRRKACEGKVRHQSLAAAMAHKDSLRLQGDHVRAYQCKFCGYWHVGHPPRR